MVNWLSVKLESEKVKKEVMRNKFKLKGEKIFIKNDLSWEERKIQDKINRWTKTERKRAGGKGRIRKRMKGVWRTWVETEKEEEERVNRKERKRYRSERKSRREKGKDRILCKLRRGYDGKGGGMKGEV